MSHAIDSVPPLKGIRLEVNYKGIYTGVSGGVDWWRVPIIATPEPKNTCAVSEVLAEIEKVLQDERGLDILPFIGDPPAGELDEITPQKVEVVVATNPDRDVLTSEMWLNDEFIGEIVPVGQKLHIVFGRRRDGQFHELDLDEFE